MVQQDDDVTLAASRRQPQRGDVTFDAFRATLSAVTTEPRARNVPRGSRRLTSAEAGRRYRDEDEEQRIELHPLAGQQAEVGEARVRDDEQDGEHHAEHDVRLASHGPERGPSHRSRNRKSTISAVPSIAAKQRLEVVGLEDERSEQHSDHGQRRPSSGESR